MKIATISSKNQITLPVDMLKWLGIKSGHKLVVKDEVENNQKKVALYPVTKNITDYYLGCAQKAFRQLGGGEKFLKTLKSEWD